MRAATPHNAAYRRDTLWLAAQVHRISGVLLACFLPLHFLVLGLAIEGEAKLGAALKFGDQPLVKLAEAGLVFLLAVHFLGGLRILYIEFVKWLPMQRPLVTGSVAAAALLAVLYLARVI